MHSIIKSKPTLPGAIARRLGLPSLVLLLVVSICICSMPIDSAWATARRLPTDQQQNQGVPSLPNISNQQQPYNNNVKIEQWDYSFTDESSGATILHYGSESESEGYTAPDVQALRVEHGVAALHAEGACEACDEIRERYQTGEIDALYRVMIVPDIEAGDDFTLSVPLGSEAHSYALYRCIDGELDVSYMAKNNSDATLTDVSVNGSAGGLQSPFGVALDASRPEELDSVQSSMTNSSEATSTRNMPPAQTPDNGDDDDDESSFDKWKGVILVIAFAIVAFVVVPVAVGRIRDSAASHRKR